MTNINKILSENASIINSINALLNNPLSKFVNEVALAGYCVQDDVYLPEVDIYIFLSTNDITNKFFELEEELERRTEGNLHFIECYPNEDAPQDTYLLWTKEGGFLYDDARISK